MVDAASVALPIVLDTVKVPPQSSETASFNDPLSVYKTQIDWSSEEAFHTPHTRSAAIPESADDHSSGTWFPLNSEKILPDLITARKSRLERLVSIETSVAPVSGDS